MRRFVHARIEVRHRISDDDQVLWQGDVFIVVPLVVRAAEALAENGLPRVQYLRGDPVSLLCCIPQISLEELLRNHKND